MRLQSYLWNHAASVRLEQYGMAHAVEGDLVLVDGVRLLTRRNGTYVCRCHAHVLSGHTHDCPAATCAQEEAGPPDAAAGDAQEVLAAAEKDGERSEPAKGGWDRPQAQKVRHVTAEESAAGSVPITDVVLPLAAPSSVYPTNAAGDVYRQLAEKDGVSLQTSPHNVRPFSIVSLTGGCVRERGSCLHASARSVRL